MPIKFLHDIDAIGELKGTSLDINGNADITGDVNIDGQFIIDTDTGNQPFYITRSGNANQSLKITTHDDNVRFESIQDETADNYGGFDFRMDGGTTEPDFMIRKGTASPLFNLKGDGTATFTGTVTSGTTVLTGTQTSVSGNAGSVTNGVYTTGAQTIAGIKEFTSEMKLGTYNSTVGGILSIHGTTANKKSTIKTTNGNLHIDAAGGHSMYLNYYTGAQSTNQNIIFGNGNTGSSGAYVRGDGRIVGTTLQSTGSVVATNLDINGNADISGNLTGVDAFTASGKIQGAELEGTSLDINGNGDVSGTLNVTGSITTTGASVNGNLYANRYFQSATGIPTNNLGAPTVTEMALFENQFKPQTTLANAYDDLADLTFFTRASGTSESDYSAVTVSDDQKRKFLRTNNSSVAIPNGHNAFRIEFVAKGYTFANAMVAYWSSQSHNSQVHVWKRRCDNNTWYQHTSSTATVSSWPGHLYLPFSTIAWLEDNTTSSGHYNKIRIEFTNITWSTGTYSDRVIALYGMQLWGGYPSGKRTVHTYDQNGKLNLFGDLDLPGTIYNATWDGDVIPSNKLSTDTAHLSETQTFTGAKTFTGITTLSNNSNHYKGHFYLDAYDNAGNHYPMFTDGSSASGATVNWRQFYGSNYKTHTWTSDASGNMGFTYQGAIIAAGSLTATELDINGNADISGKLKVGNAWDSGTLSNNSFYVQNSTDGFAFGVGTGISTWFSYSNTGGQNRMIDVDNDGTYIKLNTGNTLRVTVGSSGTTFAGTVTSSGIVLDGNTITGIDDSGEFTDNDAHIMTSAAVQDKILGYGYGTGTSNLAIGTTSTTAMAGNTSIPSISGLASTSYVDTAVANLIDSAPANLNTLNELAEALNDDDDAIVTINTALGTKLPLAGGTMTGVLTMTQNNGIPINITGANSTYTAIAIKNTGSGNAGIYYDAINGDLSGGDYGFIGQSNSGFMEYHIGPNSPQAWHAFNAPVKVVGELEATSLDINGNASVESTGVSGTPTLDIINTSSSTFNHSIEVMTPNMTSGENNILVIGRAGSTKNAGYIGYKYSSAGANANVLSLGHWGSDNLLNIDGIGNVGIGITSPQQKIHIVDTNGANIILNSNTGAENSGIFMTEGGVASPYTNGAYMYYDGANNAFKINTGTTSLSTKFTIDRDSGNATFAGTVTGTTLTGTSLDINGAADISGTLTVGGSAQHHVSQYTAPDNQVSFDRTSSSDQWFRIITSTSAPKRIKLSVSSNGDNTNTQDQYFISQSGYSMQSHIFRLPGSKYNTSKLISVMSLNPTGSTQDVWIKLLGISSGTGTTVISANVPISSSSAILATATTTKPTLQTGDTELEISVADRNAFTTMSSRGGKFGGDVTVAGEVEAASLDISGNADIDGTLNADGLDIDGNADISGNLTGVDALTASTFIGTGGYHEFGNDTGSVSNDGSWHARLNVAGTSHARIDARQSTGDGIITTMYSHNGHAAGKLGTMSNHPVNFMIAGVTRATLDGSSNFAVTGELEGGSLDINGNADISGNLTLSGSLQADKTLSIGSGSSRFIFHSGTSSVTGSGTANATEIDWKDSIHYIPSLAYAFRVKLVVTGTGTDTGASYIVYYNNTTSAWVSRYINRAGVSSNHVQLTIASDAGGTYMAAYHTHSGTYNIRYWVETFDSGDQDMDAHAFGSDFQWQRSNDTLTYTDGDVTVGSNSLTAGSLDINGNADISGNLTGLNDITSTNYYIGGHRIDDVDLAGEFVDSSTHLMSSAAVNDRIQASIIANTDTQDLSISGRAISLTNGGSVTVPAPTYSSVTGKPTTFAPSSHNHDDRYFTETESDARFLKYKGVAAAGDWDTIFTTGTGNTNTSGLFQINNHAATGNSNTPTGSYTYGSVLAWQLANATFKLYAPHTGGLHYQTGWNNDEYSGWRKIWDSGNDGAGSGLDADLLDGQQGSHYLAAANLTGTVASANLDSDTAHLSTTQTFTGTKTFSNTTQHNGGISSNGLVTISYGDISTGENVGLAINNTSSVDQLWNITSGTTNVDNETFTIRDGTANVNCFRMLKSSGNATFTGTVTAASFTGQHFADTSDSGKVINPAGASTINSLTTTGNITAGANSVTAGSFIIGGHTISDVNIAGEFNDVDTKLMTAAAINDRIQASIIANTDTQDLSINGTTLSLTNSPDITIPQRAVSTSVSSTSTTVAGYIICG